MGNFLSLDPIRIEGFDPLGRPGIDLIERGHYNLFVEPEVIEVLRKVPLGDKPVAPMILGRKKLLAHLSSRGIRQEMAAGFPIQFIGDMLAEFLFHQEHSLGPCLKEAPEMVSLFLCAGSMKMFQVSYLDASNFFVLRFRREQDNPWLPGTQILHPYLAG